MASDDLKSIVENGNISLAQGFTNSVWKPYNAHIELFKSKSPSERQIDENFTAFSRAAFKYFEDIPIARVTIYGSDFKPIINTDQSHVGVPETGSEIDNATVFMESVKGGISSRILPDTAYKSANGRIQKATLIQTIFPIKSDSYVGVVANNPAPQIEGYIEVLYDITPQWHQLYIFQLVGTAGIIIIFLILLAALYYTSKYAESIISAKHEENLELIAAKARAEAESHEKSQFLANVSHELRTPLNAIIGFSEIMKNETYGPVGSEQYQEYVRDINTSGSHLLSLINDILDFSKAEAGKLEMESGDLDLRKLLKSSLRFVMPRAEEAGVELIEEIPAENIVLYSDAKRLKQVILNLLSNAVKFTPSGGKVTLSARYGITGTTMIIEVKDTGIGMAPKDISKALSPFGQIDSELSRKYEGTGLGLPLTKKLVELMGGRFDIKSEIGYGTSIIIELPVNK